MEQIINVSFMDYTARKKTSRQRLRISWRILFALTQIEVY
jgi:hypothetical protein